MIGMLLSHPEFRPERLAQPAHAHVRRVADAGRAPRPAARRVPDARHLPGLRHDGVVGGADRARPRGAPRRRRAAAVGRSAAARRRALDPGRRRRDPCPTGETGEVCARGGNFMREYWKQPEATAEAFRDGWYHSGDAGYLDDRRLPVPRRPGEGHDRHRRRERVLGRGRERDRIAPRRRAGRGDRHPVREVGRGRARDRRVTRGRRTAPRPRSSSTPASGSPATRSRSRSSSAPSRCRCRAR